MKRCFAVVFVMLLAVCLVPAPAGAEDAAAPAAEAASSDSSVVLVTIYRIAPGKQLEFLKWMAEEEAINKQVGVPNGQMYAHLDGDSWDYVAISPVLSDEQEDKVAAEAKRRGRKTGFAAGLQFRSYVASHTDTFAQGPTSATELLAAAGE